jgi:hypothetical protein
MGSKQGEHYSEEETRRRVEAALRAAFSAPHKPQSEMKLGQRKPRKNAARRKPRRAKIVSR